VSSAAGTAVPHTCPRCRTPLEPATLRQIPVEACKSCKGTLLAQGRLSELLDELSTPLLRSFDIDAKLEATNDPNGRVDCPRCEKQMDRDDYCAAGLVFFDRCTPCALLWLDADELGAMTLMWARMNGRQAREQAITREVSMSFLPSAVRSGSVDRSTLSRSVFDMLFW
jgi:Zn-finger nucleic acid-binding protein